MSEEKKREKNERYYYLCSYPLVQGSVVERGNWGRICRLESLKKGTPLSLLREYIFEVIRVQEFPNRPSRFDCSFLCSNISSLMKFLRLRPFDLPYEVELNDQNAKKFETDWSLIRSNYNNAMDIEKDARKFWNPQDVEDENKEALTESDIRIVRRICTTQI